MSAPPPQLHFDDGSRVIMENQATANANDSTTSPSVAHAAIHINPRGDTPIEIYYELDRIAIEILKNIVPNSPSPADSGFLCKVALQFPDELLNDSAQVAWLLEESIESCYESSLLEQAQADEEKVYNIPLVFVLGDTTYASCCPDEIGAQHLKADVIVHFGQYACLSVSDSLPVIYCFGVQEWPGLQCCADRIISQIQMEREEHKEEVEGDAHKGLILVCERRYQNHIGTLAEVLENEGIPNVLIGNIPISDGNEERKMVYQAMSDGCCQSSGQEQECCNKAESASIDEGCQSEQNAEPCCEQNQDCCNYDNESQEINAESTSSREREAREESALSNSENSCFIGGLHIATTSTELSKYTLVFIGDDSGKSKSRQFLNTILKCTTPGTSTKTCWSYNPSTEQLSTDPMSIIGVSRYLNRRFYLTQKAKTANIIGILVGTLSQDRFRSVVASVRQKIEESGRTSYTFVVGKINVAKLANFAEVDCFVLVACGETSILADERDYHLPVITPTELEIALGEKEWGGAGSCNTDFGDFLQGFEDGQDSVNAEHDNVAAGVDSCIEGSTEECSSDDEPYFSMVSGTFVSKPVSLKSQRKSQESSNLESLPGQGKMTEYKSEAAEFWKKREYKGLEAKIGKDNAKAAVKGQTGIASDYGK